MVNVRASRTCLGEECPRFRDRRPDNRVAIIPPVFLGFPSQGCQRGAKLNGGTKWVEWLETKQRRVEATSDTIDASVAKFGTTALEKLRQANGNPIHRPPEYERRRR